MARGSMAVAAVLLSATLGIAMAGSEHVISDREKAGLREAVKSCAEEQGSVTNGETRWAVATTTEYDRAGRIVSRKFGTGESSWGYKNTYAPDGRLLKTSPEGKDGGAEERTFSYDDAGRLVGVRRTGDPGENLRFEYDAAGRKSAVYTAGPKRKEENVAFALSPPDGSDHAFEAGAHTRCEAFEACASTRIVYNEHDRPTEAQLRDADGHVISRLVRTFDDKGNVTAERQVNESPELMVPAELKEQLNPAQRKSIGTVFAAMSGLGTSYVYDSHNRVQERQSEDLSMGRVVTTFSYNEHGDLSGEKTTRSGGQGFSGSLNEDGTIMPGPASGGMPPEYAETRYTYEYDTYGNWTEQKVEIRSKPDEPFRVSIVRRHKLSYHGLD